MGKPPPGVPPTRKEMSSNRVSLQRRLKSLPGDDAHEGAIRIFGVISVLSDKRRFGNEFTTRKKLLSGEDGLCPSHHPPSMPEPES